MSDKAKDLRIAELEFWEGVMDHEVDILRERIAELEAAIDKLAAGKGRYHTGANFKELIAVREKGRGK